MHSRIFQITEKPISPDDYITESSYDRVEQADYWCNTDDDENEDDIKWLDSVMHRIFSRDDRQLTLKDMTGFIDEWKEAITEAADNLDMKAWCPMFRLESIVKKTQMDCDFLFDYDGYPATTGEFILWLYRNYKPGDRFYIGGILDYHF